MEMSLERVGIVTVTGLRLSEIDGLALGWARKTIRFNLTPSGLTRRGKLYRTFDASLLVPEWRDVNVTTTT